MVRIKDPCETTVVNHDAGVFFVNGTIDTSNATSVYNSPVQDGPKDSAADSYSNGYDLCNFLYY